MIHMATRKGSLILFQLYPDCSPSLCRVHTYGSKPHRFPIINRNWHFKCDRACEMLIKASSCRRDAEIVFHSSCFLKWFLLGILASNCTIPIFILCFYRRACHKWDLLQDVLWLYCLLLPWLHFQLIVRVIQSRCKPCTARSGQQSTKQTFFLHIPLQT